MRHWSREGGRLSSHASDDDNDGQPLDLEQGGGGLNGDEGVRVSDSRRWSRVAGRLSRSAPSHTSDDNDGQPLDLEQGGGGFLLPNDDERVMVSDSRRASLVRTDTGGKRRRVEPRSQATAGEDDGQGFQPPPPPEDEESDEQCINQIVTSTPSTRRHPTHWLIYAQAASSS